MEHEHDHDYISTSCFHGLHTICRLVCKYCRTPCQCACHIESARPEKKTSPDLVAAEAGAAKAA
jgi:hypothetical protein